MCTAFDLGTRQPSLVQSGMDHHSDAADELAEAGPVRSDISLKT